MCSEPSQTSKMDLYAKVAVIYFRKNLRVRDFQLGSKHASVQGHIRLSTVTTQKIFWNFIVSNLCEYGLISDIWIAISHKCHKYRDVFRTLSNMELSKEIDNIF